MRYTLDTRIRVRGDYARAKRHFSYVRVLQGMLQNQMELGGIEFGTWSQILRDGTEVRVVQHGEQILLEIVSPGPEEGEEVVILPPYYMESGRITADAYATEDPDSYNPATVYYGDPVTDNRHEDARLGRAFIRGNGTNRRFEGENKDPGESRAVGCPEDDRVDGLILGFPPTAHTGGDWCEDLLDKSLCQDRVAPGIYTGLMKLWVQARYGSLQDDYFCDDTNPPYRLSVEIDADQAWYLNNSLGASAGMYLDAEYNPFLLIVTDETLSVYRMQLTLNGELLRDFLQDHPPASDLEYDQLVGYLFTETTLTADGAVVHTFDEPCVGTTFGYGWKFNMDGNVMDVVTNRVHPDFASDPDNLRYQAHHYRVTLTDSGTGDIEDRFSAEWEIVEQVTWLCRLAEDIIFKPNHTLGYHQAFVPYDPPPVPNFFSPIAAPWYVYYDRNTLRVHRYERIFIGGVSAQADDWGGDCGGGPPGSSDPPALDPDDYDPPFGESGGTRSVDWGCGPWYYNYWGYTSTNVKSAGFYCPVPGDDPLYDTREVFYDDQVAATAVDHYYADQDQTYDPTYAATTAEIKFSTCDHPFPTKPNNGQNISNTVNAYLTSYTFWRNRMGMNATTAHRPFVIVPFDNASAVYFGTWNRVIASLVNRGLVNQTVSPILLNYRYKTFTTPVQYGPWSGDKCVPTKYIVGPAQGPQPINDNDTCTRSSVVFEEISAGLCYHSVILNLHSENAVTTDGTGDVCDNAGQGNWETPPNFPANIFNFTAPTEGDEEELEDNGWYDKFVDVDFLVFPYVQELLFNEISMRDSIIYNTKPFEGELTQAEFRAATDGYNISRGSFVGWG